MKVRILKERGKEVVPFVKPLKYPRTSIVNVLSRPLSFKNKFGFGTILNRNINITEMVL
jgi:hypothetical protein